MAAEATARQRDAATLSVHDAVSVIAVHRLCKVEAVRSFSKGFGRMNGQLRVMLAMEQKNWQGDTLFFRMRPLRQTAAGSVEVFQESRAVRVQAESKARCEVLGLARRLG